MAVSWECVRRVTRRRRRRRRIEGFKADNPVPVALSLGYMRKPQRLLLLLLLLLNECFDICKDLSVARYSWGEPGTRELNARDDSCLLLLLTSPHHSPPSFPHDLTLT